MTLDTLLSRVLNWFQNQDQPEIGETVSGSEIELGFVGECGEKISFEDIANGLPSHYAITDENGLPPLEERVIISKNIKFYDLFQIVEVSENDAERLKFTTGAGWYWVTYFGEPISGFGHVGPFSSEEEALSDAASKALPINVPRRSEFRYGLIGDGTKISLQGMFGKAPI